VVGTGPAMEAVFRLMTKAAGSTIAVLIQGETGTGKERIAQAIHQLSPRRDERFVKIHCAELSASIIESELFGHEKGAFTGADQQRKGRFEIADGGTLFIDEVSEIPPPIQTKLLRVLQDRQFERVGGNETVKVDVRVVAATNRRLDILVARGEFREDLYYRMRVIQLDAPPLRERKEDIALLTEVFIREFNREHGRKVTGITRGVADRFMEYGWPGNVRELKNVIEEMVVFHQHRGPLDAADLPLALRHQPAGRTEDLGLSVGMSLREIEKRTIEATLRSTGHDKQKTARILGMGLRTLYRKQKEYGL